MVFINAGCQHGTQSWHWCLCTQNCLFDQPPHVYTDVRDSTCCSPKRVTGSLMARRAARTSASLVGTLVSRKARLSSTTCSNRSCCCLASLLACNHDYVSELHYSVSSPCNLMGRPREVRGLRHRLPAGVCCLLQRLLRWCLAQRRY